ncbi:hypothetical protein TNCV_4379011 [Trichonephila clavipes]|nr:hypothetical protein TNCV_4379011 [Trichonephila clavipes]
MTEQQKVLCFEDKRILSAAIRSDLSDAGVSVGSKTIRNRLADQNSALCHTVKYLKDLLRSLSCCPGQKQSWA